MARSIYIINPKARHTSYFDMGIASHLGKGNFQYIADLAIPTVAALVPSDFNIQLCDEYITPVNLDIEVDFVALTGKVTQVSRMLELADHFRRRGITVLIGGPFASLSPEVVRSHCDILVCGEIEEIATTLFSDLREGYWQDRYTGEKVDLANSPVPRWDLYPNHRAVLGCIQTSRGCPFECEFCDVIQYAGRKQRHKPVGQVLEELDCLYAHGYRSVFIADDNFTVYRQRAKELLLALRQWNKRQTAGRVSFVTQVSIDVAKDLELLEMCRDASLTGFFIGIETINEASLRETGKRQNLLMDTGEALKRIIGHGIIVSSGLMIGFDADYADIFDRQLMFVQQTPVPLYMLGTVNAPPTTPLYTRLLKDNRIYNQAGTDQIGGGIPWESNIVPLRMSRTELVEGVMRLGRTIYTPEAFIERLQLLAETFKAGGEHSRSPGAGLPPKDILDLGAHLIRHVATLGDAERKMIKQVLRLMMLSPTAAAPLRGALQLYAQIRFMYEQAYQAPSRM